MAFPLQVGGEVLPQEEALKYLGVLFMKEGRLEREPARWCGVPDHCGEEERSHKAKLSIY